MIKQEELLKLIDMGEIFDQKSWRWGTNYCYHVIKDGTDYIVWVRVHIQEGIQDEEFELIPAKKIERTITTWVAI